MVPLCTSLAVSPRTATPTTPATPFLVPVEQIEYGFRYIIVRPPYTPYSIYLRDYNPYTLNPSYLRGTLTLYYGPLHPKPYLLKGDSNLIITLKFPPLRLAPRGSRKYPGAPTAHFRILCLGFRVSLGFRVYGLY